MTAGAKYTDWAFFWLQGKDLSFLLRWILMRSLWPMSAFYLCSSYGRDNPLGQVSYKGAWLCFANCWSYCGTATATAQYVSISEDVTELLLAWLETETGVCTSGLRVVGSYGMCRCRRFLSNYDRQSEVPESGENCLLRPLNAERLVCTWLTCKVASDSSWLCIQRVCCSNELSCRGDYTISLPNLYIGA